MSGGENILLALNFERKYLILWLMHLKALNLCIPTKFTSESTEINTYKDWDISENIIYGQCIM